MSFSWGRDGFTLRDAELALRVEAKHRQDVRIRSGTTLFDLQAPEGNVTPLLPGGNTTDVLRMGASITDALRVIVR